MINRQDPLGRFVLVIFTIGLIIDANNSNKKGLIHFVDIVKRSDSDPGDLLLLPFIMGCSPAVHALVVFQALLQLL